jgi:sugar lactone lactonase YvrE
MPARRSSIFFLTAFAIAVLPPLAVPARSQQKQGSASPAAAAQTAAKARVAANYGHIPLSFEANRGQTDPSVQFLSRSQGYTLFLRPDEAVLALRSAKPRGTGTPLLADSLLAIPSPADPRGRLAPNPGEIETSLVRMKLVGANAHAAVHEEDQKITQTNYFIGNDPIKWRTDIPNFGRVRYAGIYPGIDLVYYGNQSQLEHDFIVAPGVNPGQIRVAMSGAKQMRIDPATGDLILNTGQGDLRLLKPISYQESNGQRTPVSSTYKLLAKNQIGFQVASYNHAQPLVIDPVLVYSTYLGGSVDDYANGIAVDSAGSAYVVGFATSDNYPTTPGAFQPQGQGNVVVTKLNPTGTALVYSTYLGGSGRSSAGTFGDIGYGIVLDSNNNAYITGATTSQDFPVNCGAFQTANPTMTTGATVAFVAKLNAAGNGLVYSTYLGGEGNEESPSGAGDVAQAIILNAAGNAYVTGYTYSSNFPVSGGAFQTNFAGTQQYANAFVTEMSLDGSALVYSTFLGGSQPGVLGSLNESVGDFGNAIAIDSFGDAFVTGSTLSEGFPVTSAAYQTSNAGVQNAFVTELNPTGSGEVYSTYLGGNSVDAGMAIAVDSNGFAYITGTTSSSNFPLTVGVLEGTNIGLEQYFLPTLKGESMEFSGAFLTKLNQNGTALDYSTDLEGAYTSPRALAVDSDGNAYVGGSAAVAWTGPQGFTLVQVGGFGGFQETPDALPVPGLSCCTAFIVKLDAAATVLNYASLIGGSNGSGANALALDGNGNVYLAGPTRDTDFPITPGAFQTANHAVPGQGGLNAFVSKLALGEELNQVSYPQMPPPPYPITISVQAAEVCDNDGENYNIAVEYNWTVNPMGFQIPSGLVSITWQNSPLWWNIGFSVSDVQDSYEDWCMGGCIQMAPNTPYSWTVTYPGDENYQPFTTTGSTEFPYCEPPRPPSSNRMKPHQPRLPGHTGLTAGVVGRARDLHLNSAAPRQLLLGPKFALPDIASKQWEPRPTSLRPQAQSPPTSGCIAGTGPLLTVSVTPASRLYGAANPNFTYTETGLRIGDLISVSFATTATPASVVGNYPVTATVTGAALANYSYRTTPITGTLTVTPAPLTVTPVDAYDLVNSIPSSVKLTSTLTGFVNGDTASVVSGAPVLTFPVDGGDNDSPGRFPITASLGTLSAANYQFVFAEGVLTVFQPVDLGAVGLGKTVSKQIDLGDGPFDPVAQAVVLTGGAVLPEFSPVSIVRNGTSRRLSFSFTPGAPGLWSGALQLMDAGSPAKTVFSLPIYGVGVGPELVFDKGLQSEVKPAGAMALVGPHSIALDGSGALYIADTPSNRILKVAGKTVTVLNLSGTSLRSPSAVFIDGAGNLYIADTDNNRIVQRAPDGATQVISVPGQTLRSPSALAVDAGGVLYIVDTGNNRVIWVTRGEGVEWLSTGTLSLAAPAGIALDTAGNLYVADTGNDRVLKMTRDGVVSVVFTGEPVLKSPSGIAVDASGTVYIAGTRSNQVIAVPPGAKLTSVVASDLASPRGIAIDHNGSLFIADTGHKRVLELHRDLSSGLIFDNTSQDKRSADSPRTITVRNIGNSALTISSVSFPADFPEDAGGKSTDCKAGKALAAAASCTLTIDFKPVDALGTSTSHVLRESIKLTSNTLSHAGTVQKVSVQGTELK